MVYHIHCQLSTVYGCLWMFMDVYGFLWLFYGCLWMFMNVYECLWMFMDAYHRYIMILSRVFMVFLNQLIECGKPNVRNHPINHP